MVGYASASSLGWLDLDAAASERVGTAPGARRAGTLDPLGLGSVRDAFSAMLSPGTSTIQTRLRYFVFLPWIFTDSSLSGSPPREFVRRLRDTEARLIDCLRHLGPTRASSATAAGRKLKRMPSEAYWGGLGSWGLRRLDLSLAEYGQRAAALGRLRPDRDDDGNATRARGVDVGHDARTPRRTSSRPTIAFDTSSGGGPGPRRSHPPTPSPFVARGPVRRSPSWRLMQLSPGICPSTGLPPSCSTSCVTPGASRS